MLEGEDRRIPFTGSGCLISLVISLVSWVGLFFFAKFIISLFGG
jgi:hypothetical protein